jgi:hypothetical protein
MAVRACSACAGDYEDPERTAEMFDEADEEEHGEALDAVTEEFPATVVERRERRQRQCETFEEEDRSESCAGGSATCFATCC